MFPPAVLCCQIYCISYSHLYGVTGDHWRDFFLTDLCQALWSCGYYKILWNCVGLSDFAGWWTTLYDASDCFWRVPMFLIIFWNVSRSCCFVLKSWIGLSLWLECFVSKYLLNFNDFLLSAANRSLHKSHCGLHKPCLPSVQVIQILFVVIFLF